MSCSANSNKSNMQGMKKLPGGSLDYLEKKNAHERDAHITFDEGPHIYTIDGSSDYTSVTTFCHSHFEHFDADKIIDKMMNSWKWPQNKYYGMTKQEIKDQWSENGRKSSEAGTKMHFDIECYYNGMSVNNESTEFQYFKNFEKFHRHLEPYRTEWMVFDKELKLAGSIDMVYAVDVLDAVENGEASDMEEDVEMIDIYDWKRCKEIKTANKWQSAKTECISHLPDCNYWHYSLQLNTYKYMLEKNYGKKVRDMYLVCLHPDNKTGNYIKYKVNHMNDELNDLMKWRKVVMGRKEGCNGEENNVIKELK